MSFVRPATLIAPTGSTGNNTHTSTNLPEDCDSFCVQFVVEVAGATPTVSYKCQVSFESLLTSDANSNWTDLIYVTEATDTTAVAVRAATAVGVQHVFPANANLARQWRKIRIVSSLNTNVTYRAELYPIRLDPQ